MSGVTLTYTGWPVNGCAARAVGSSKQFTRYASMRHDTRGASMRSKSVYIAADSRHRANEKRSVFKTSKEENALAKHLFVNLYRFRTDVVHVLTITTLHLVSCVLCKMIQTYT